VISCESINKSDNSSGFISGFFGLPGLATWAARPGPNPLTPGPAQPDPISARAGPISPSPIARLGISWDAWKGDEKSRDKGEGILSHRVYSLHFCPTCRRLLFSVVDCLSFSSCLSLVPFISFLYALKWGTSYCNKARRIVFDIRIKWYSS